MTHLIPSEFSENDVILALSALPIEILRTIYRAAISSLKASNYFTGNRTPAWLAEHCVLDAEELMTDKTWRAVQASSKAALITFGTVMQAKGQIVKSASYLQVSQDTLSSGGFLSGNLIVRGGAADSWMASTVPELA